MHCGMTDNVKCCRRPFSDSLALAAYCQWIRRIQCTIGDGDYDAVTSIS